MCYRMGELQFLFTAEACQDAAATWDEELVRRWFAVDRIQFFSMFLKRRLIKGESKFQRMTSNLKK